MAVSARWHVPDKSEQWRNDVSFRKQQLTTTPMTTVSPPKPWERAGAAGTGGVLAMDRSSISQPSPAAGCPASGATTGVCPAGILRNFFEFLQAHSNFLVKVGFQLRQLGRLVLPLQQTQHKTKQVELTF